MASITTIGPDEKARFEELFQRPSIERMIPDAMGWTEFEQFIGYVFTCAGYVVEYVGGSHFPIGPGVDFNLYARVNAKKPVARVEVRQRTPPNAIGYNEVMAFAGTLGSVENASVPGYLVTTGTFGAGAKAGAASAGVSLQLVDGEHLVRYIRYIGGSRVEQAEGYPRTLALTPPDLLLLIENPQLRDSVKQPVLTISNNKGGVAKTTTTLNLGLALAAYGKRVLLVDMDGQATLSSALPPPDPMPKPPKGSEPPKHERYITSFFSGRTSRLCELVEPTRHDNVWLLAANHDLHRMDTGGSARPDAELAFIRAIHSPDLMGLDGLPFDWILLDTPPAQSFFTRLALASAHHVLIPANVEVFTVNGLSQVVSMIDTMQAFVGHGIRPIGCLRTRWKKTAAGMTLQNKLVNDLYLKGIPLFATVIPFDDKVEQANLSVVDGGAKTLFFFGSSKAGSAYSVATGELLEKVGKYVN